MYDLDSFLPYRGDRPVTLSMRVGFTARDPDRLGARDWEELARACRLDPAETLRRVADLADRVVAVTDAVLRDVEVTRWASPLPERLMAAVTDHVEACRRRL